MWYWTIRGRLGEGRRWSHKALQNVNDAQPHLHAHIMAAEGSFACSRVNFLLRARSSSKASPFIERVILHDNKD
jgi:hypothetical protein